MHKGDSIEEIKGTANANAVDKGISSGGIIAVEYIPENDSIVDADDVAAGTYGSLESAMHNDRLNRFNSRQGHGFAAEQANHQLDILHGRDAVILGDDNAKNGADRMVDGQLIQTKYCQTAAESINAGFSNGQYKYLDATGKPMQIEVPMDQYDEAVRCMAEKIRKGEVPKTTNPEDAAKIVRRGNVTLQQARNIAKAGNIDSIKFDAANGVVIGVGAFAISSAITFAKAMWSGEPIEKALDMTIYNGLQAGGIGFTTSILTAQLTRTSLNNALMQPSISLVKMLPSNVRHYIVNSMRSNAPIYGSAASNNLAKLVRGNIIAAGVLTVVLSSGDIYRFLTGRISGKQLFKSITTLATGISVGVITAVAISNPVLAFLTAGAAGSLGSVGAKRVLDSFIEDDAVEMVRIINDCFVPLAQEYLLSEEELGIIVDDLKLVLVHNVLLDMYASRDREKYATDLLTKLIEKTIQYRSRVIIPNQEEMASSIGRVMGMALDGEDISQILAPTKVDTVALGTKLLGREVAKQSADKAWYVTKQTNITLIQGEVVLQRMADNERKFKVDYEETLRRIDLSKAEIDELLENFSHN